MNFVENVQLAPDSLPVRIGSIVVMTGMGIPTRALLLALGPQLPETRAKAQPSHEDPAGSRIEFQSLKLLGLFGFKPRMEHLRFGMRVLTVGTW